MHTNFVISLKYKKVGTYFLLHLPNKRVDFENANKNKEKIQKIFKTFRKAQNVVKSPTFVTKQRTKVVGVRKSIWTFESSLNEEFDIQ